MIDLSPIAGMPLFLDGTRLLAGAGQDELVPARRRTVDDLKNVWQDESLRGNTEVYATYMDVVQPDHRALFARHGIQRGVVVMPPGLFGHEKPKLYGHYHPLDDASGAATPEVHMVLSGCGLFLLQRAVPPYDEINDLVVVEAQAGEAFIIPPDYGHVVINAGDQVMVYEGYLDAHMQPDYTPYRRRRGAAYYLLEDHGGGLHYQVNPHYPVLPPLRHVRAMPIAGISWLQSASSPYQAVLTSPEQFSFITHPGEYLQEWKI